MAKRILKEEQLIDVIWGATLMGGGGGGAMVGGTDLLNTYKKLHPEKPVELTLLETCDIPTPTVLSQQVWALPPF